MRTIKNLSFVLMTAALAVFMTACGGGSGPKDTAVAFLNALQEQDFETAKKHATANSAEMLDMLASMSAMGGEEGETEPKEITITDTQTEGDNATVTYTIEGEEEEQTLDLTKEEGEWKVVFDKSSLGGGMNMDMEEDMEEEHDMEDHDHEMESDTMMMEGDTGASM